MEGSGLEEWNTGNVEPNQVTVINFHQAVHQQHPGRGANGRYKIASTRMKEREKEAGRPSSSKEEGTNPSSILWTPMKNNFTHLIPIPMIPLKYSLQYPKILITVSKFRIIIILEGIGISRNISFPGKKIVKI